MGGVVMLVGLLLGCLGLLMISAPELGRAWRARGPAAPGPAATDGQPGDNGARARGLLILVIGLAMLLVGLGIS